MTTDKISMPTRVGVIASSSVVPQVELKIALKKMIASGFEPVVHPQVRKKDFIFSGSDQERAQAFFDFAFDPSFSVLWSARGGYGANHILPYLDRWTAEKGKPPQKLLVGFSDVTALHAFVSERWGWSTLHAPMPASKSFLTMKRADWDTVVHWVKAQRSSASWQGKKLKVLNPEILNEDIEGTLVGGNLTVWNSLLGTPFAPSFSGEASKILFFEDISESVSRIDRMVQQLAQARGFRNVRAIILGDFLDCEDSAPSFLKAEPKPARLMGALTKPRPSEIKPLRAKISQSQAFKHIFGELGAKRGIVIAAGLPVGHGPNYAPLPLSARYKLTVGGKFELLSWDWFS